MAAYLAAAELEMLRTIGNLKLKDHLAFESFVRWEHWTDAQRAIVWPEPTVSGV